MLLNFFLWLFLCESTVKCFSPTSPTFSPEISNATVAKEEELSPLQLVATPDYPVAAGQSVNLHCSSAFTMPEHVSWSWQHLENQTWKEVGTGRDLTLTEPEQSGLYRCFAKSQLSMGRESRNHTVYIISMPTTVSNNLGIAALVFSLLALIINFAVVFWLGWQRLNDMSTISNTAAKGFPGPEKSPKGSFPQTDGDGDVYMNYTSTNQAYTDLNPTNVTGDNAYSSLS
ncbi:uncharacterized protein [Pempheris klunzingeri]|uniref:uncharacterized protein n=1 Tax=Pempheris klunzingeri TaxID=3127111 RepID=UPI00397FE925